MATTALTPPTPAEAFPLWLNELQEADRATGPAKPQAPHPFIISSNVRAVASANSGSLT